MRCAHEKQVSFASHEETCSRRRTQVDENRIGEVVVRQLPEELSSGRGGENQRRSHNES